MNNATSNDLSAPASLLTDLVDDQPFSSSVSTVVLDTSLFPISERIFGTESADYIQDTSANNTIFAGGGDDAILTSAGNNIIYTVNIRNRGGFENDYLNLGSGQDTVVLGDALGSYYITDGWQDNVYIEDFEVGEDRLVLHGDRDLYTVQSTDSGAWLLFGDNSETAIAFLKNVQDFDLNSSSVSFLQGAQLEPIAEPALDPVEDSAPTQSVEEATDEVVESLNFYLQLGVPKYREVVGGIGDDLLVGGADSDQLIGFGGRDYAFGGGGADLFVLGDFSRAFYTLSGWDDSVYIDDFTAGEDQLQLHGSASQYSTEVTQTGLWLYAEGDAIAFFNGVQSLDLSAAQYREL